MTPLLILHDAMALLLGMLLVVRAPAVARSWAAELRCWIGFLALTGVLAIPLAVITLGPFFLLHLWVHLLTYVSGLLVIARCIRLWPHRRRMALSLIGASTIVMATWLHSHLIEPYRLEVVTERIEVARPPKQPLRIALLADLQCDAFGPYEERVLRELAATKADLVLAAGDFLQVYGDERDVHRARLATALARFEPWPRLGFFAVDGDVDTAEGGIGGTRVLALVDESVSFPEEGFQLMGLSLGTGARGLSPGLMARISSFDGLSIVLSHRPDFILPWIDGRERAPILALAGHTHGGQVNIPFLGPPITATRVPRSIAAGKLTAMGDSWVRVSRGTGMERGAAPRVRFNCRPEIVVLEVAARP